MKKTAVILFAAAALAGCKGKNGAGDVQQDNRVLTKTETAESATVQLTEEFTSEIEPFRENDITPAASGVHIDRILVEVGDPVHEGQLIVTLDPTQYTQQLVQLKTVEDDYNRLLPVYEAGGISAQQIQQAKAQLPDMVRHWAQEMGVTPTGLKITSARTRFGSCSGKNSLCFSLYLMEYPPEAIEAVVVHELAHIRHKNHGSDFYTLVRQYLPDYDRQIKLLK